MQGNQLAFLVNPLPVAGSFKQLEQGGDLGKRCRLAGAAVEYQFFHFDPDAPLFARPGPAGEVVEQILVRCNGGVELLFE